MRLLSSIWHSAQRSILSWRSLATIFLAGWHCQWHGKFDVARPDSVGRIPRPAKWVSSRPKAVEEFSAGPAVRFCESPCQVIVFSIELLFDIQRGENAKHQEGTFRHATSHDTKSHKPRDQKENTHPPRRPDTPGDAGRPFSRSCCHWADEHASCAGRVQRPATMP